MNIIYERTGVRYHEVHVYRLLDKRGFRERFVILHEEKKQFKKGPRK